MDPLMTVWVFVIGIFMGSIIGIILSYRTVVVPLHQTVDHLTTQDERYHEKMKYYPYASEQFRFLNGPVDGIQFNDDEVLFVCFREENTPMTRDQEKVKNLVDAGKIRWYEFETS
jgi:predicted Holliday junction resolvase-like endonuclease